MSVCLCVLPFASFVWFIVCHDTNQLHAPFLVYVCVCVRVYSATFCGAISGLLRRTRASLLRTREMEALMR